MVDCVNLIRDGLCDLSEDIFVPFYRVVYVVLRSKICGCGCRLVDSSGTLQVVKTE